MKRSVPNFLIEGMRLVAHCALCKSEEGTSRHVLEADEEACLMHVECASCKGAIIASVSREELGVSCVGIMTDLSSSEAQRLLVKKPIQMDRVLEIHEALHAADFLRLFTAAS